MRHPILGVGFLQQTVSLPSQAFISIYAIHWLQANMEGVTYEKAITIMEVTYNLANVVKSGGIIVSCILLLLLPNTSSKLGLIQLISLQLNDYLIIWFDYLLCSGAYSLQSFTIDQRFDCDFYVNCIKFNIILIYNTNSNG